MRTHLALLLAFAVAGTPAAFAQMSDRSPGTAAPNALPGSEIKEFDSLQKCLNLPAKSDQGLSSEYTQLGCRKVLDNNRKQCKGLSGASQNETGRKEFEQRRCAETLSRRS